MTSQIIPPVNAPLMCHADKLLMQGSGSGLCSWVMLAQLANIQNIGSQSFTGMFNPLYVWGYGGNWPQKGDKTYETQDREF